MKRADLLGIEIDCKCGRHHSVPVRQFVIERGAIESVPKVLADFGLLTNVFLLADETTYEVAGRRVHSILNSAGCNVSLLVLKEKPIASYNTASGVLKSYVSSDVIVSCGSGTVTDLGKQLANEVGIPLVAVATAPSMNGYASSIVALMKDGVKVASPLAPAKAVIVDLDIMCNAPLEMIRAGLGDALAKPVSNADWKLASIMRDQHFCDLAFKLVKDLESTYFSRAEGIGKRDLKAIAALSEALLYSGISMVLAGSSAPVSGGEHLISHTLDMHAGVVGRNPDFHGAQVGVATLFTSRLYEKLFRLSADDLKVLLKANILPDDFALEERINRYFGPLAPNVMKEFSKKRQDRKSLISDREKIIESWEIMRSEISPFLSSSAVLERVLRDAGCKTNYSQLGVNRTEFTETIFLARTIRPRYNILDVAWQLGTLEEIIEEEE